jgi:hypothetical protein
MISISGQICESLATVFGALCKRSLEMFPFSPIGTSPLCGEHWEGTAFGGDVIDEPDGAGASVVRRVASGLFSQGVAAERLGIGLRQMKRLMRQWRTFGDAGLVSRQRGHGSNRSLSSDFHSVLEEHFRGQYQGFGATLAAEKLAEREGSRYRRRRFAAPRSDLVCGAQNPAGKSGCISSANAVPGSAS